MKRQKIAIFVLIGLALVTALILAWRPLLNGILRRALISEVSRRLDAQVTLDTLELSLFPLRLSMEGVSIRPAKSPLKFIGIRRIEVEPKMAPAMLAKIAIARIRIEEPVLRVEIDEIAAPQKRKKLEFLKIPFLRDLIRVEIGEILLNGAKLSVRVPSQDARLTVGSGNMRFKAAKDNVETWSWAGDGFLQWGDKNLHLDQVQITAERKGEEVSIKRFSLRAPEIEATLRGKAYPVASLKYAVRSPLSVLNSKLKSLGIFKKDADLSGHLVSRGKLEGSWDNLKTSNEWTVQNFNFGGRTIDSIVVRGKTQGFRVNSLSGTVYAADTEVNFTVGKIVEGRPASFELNAKKIALARFLKTIAPRHVPVTTANVDVGASGEISFRPFSVNGKYEVKSEKLKIELPQSIRPYLPLEFRSIQSHGNMKWYKAGFLALEGGKLNAEGIDANYRFEFHSDGSTTGEWEAQIANMGGAFSPSFPAKGDGKVTGGLHVQKSAQSVLLDIDLPRLGYASRQPLPFHGAIVFRNEGVELNGFQLGSDSVGASVEAWFPHGDTGMRLDAKFHGLDFAWMAAVAANRYPFLKAIDGGLARGSLNLTGANRSVRGLISLSADLPSWNGTVLEKIDAVVDLEAGGVIFQKGLVRTKEGDARVTGAIAKDEYRDFEIVLRKFPLELVRFPSWLGGFSSHLDGAFRFNGDLNDPQVEAESTGFYKTENGDRFEPRWLATGKEKWSNLKWVVQDLNHTLDAKGSIDLKTLRRFEGEGTFNRFSLSPFFKNAVSSVTGHWNLAGSLRSWSEFSGGFGFSQAEISRGDWKIELKENAEGSVKNGRLLLPPVRLQGVSTDLVAGVEIAPDGALKSDVEGKISLGLLSVILPAITRADGRLDLGVEVRGNVRDPRLTGKASLEHGVLQFKNFPQSLDEVSLQANLNQKRIMVDQMTGQLGGGRVEASGVVNVGNDLKSTMISFDGKTEQVQLRFPSWLPSRFSGPISLVGPLARPLLSGDLLVHEATYRDTWDWKKKVLTFGRAGRKDVFARYEDENIAFDIKFRSEQDHFFLKNNIATGKLSGNLRLVGTDKRIGLLGRVEVISGQVSFLDNLFEITTGTVAFESESSVKMNFDITAKTTASNVDIFLDLRTQDDEVRVFLSSQPAKEETSIVALLTLGVDVDELSTAGADQSLGASVVPSVLSSPLQSNLEGGLKRAKIIDTFQFAPFYSEGTRTTGLKMTVGKQLFPKVKLLYATDVFNIGTDNSVKLEQGFNEHVSMQGSYTDNKEVTNSDFDLGFDFEFKFEF